MPLSAAPTRGAVLALLLGGVTACSDEHVLPAPTPVGVTWAAAAPVAEVDARFLSFTLDTDLVVAHRFPLDSPRLRTLARQLAPALLRVGGTEADRVYYDLATAPASEAPAPYEHVLDRAIWDGVCDFAQASGVELLFDVNAGPGPRAEDGSWTDGNARELLTYSVAQGCPVEVWEFGNEPGAFVLEHGLSVEGQSYGQDFERFAAMVRDVDDSARAAAPAVAYWPLWGEVLVPLLEDFAAQAGDSIDVLTWHFYPQQSNSCPLASYRIPDPPVLDAAALDEVATWAAEVESVRRRHAPEAEIWLGETGHAQCGGEPGISDRYVTGFWWLDELGQMARRGQQVVMRQALVGGAYTLLTRDELAPRPDYFNSLLWKRLMGVRVLPVQVDSPGPSVRAYAHCTPAAAGPAGALTLLLINLHTRAVSIHLPEHAGPRVRPYLLTAADLLSATVELNGETLIAAEDGTVHLPSPGEITGPIELPPQSYGFFVLVDAQVAACEG